MTISVMLFEIAVVLLQQQMENADAERDVYDELLTQAEIQGNVNKVNGELQEQTHTHVLIWSRVLVSMVQK